MQKDRVKKVLGIGSLILSIGFVIVLDIIKIFFGNFKSALCALLSLIVIVTTILLLFLFRDDKNLKKKNIDAEI